VAPAAQGPLQAHERGHPRLRHDPPGRQDPRVSVGRQGLPVAAARPQAIPVRVSIQVRVRRRHRRPQSGRLQSGRPQGIIILINIIYDHVKYGVRFFLLDLFLDLFESKWLFEYKIR
jgi:hypothetical protein